SALFPIASLGAQETRGTITGKVMDANNAVVPSAPVKITNTAKGTSVSVVSNDSGYFVAPYLVSGSYQIVVEVQGFKQYVRSNLEVRIGETLDVPIVLETGGTEESITVTGATQQLDTETGSMGQTVDNRRVAELPLVHGDPYTMIGLAPGVTFARDQRL